MNSRIHKRPAPPQRIDPWDGLLLVDKSGGMTSHDVVAAVRRTFQLKKVGHGGTLDPMATGLLVLLIGRGTKLSDKLIGSDKCYEGTMKLGIRTTTQDAEGEVTDESDPSGVTEPDLVSAMQEWIGDVMQTPPMVSAIKQNGVPLYKLARKGKTVERKPRLLHIYEFPLLAYDPPLASFRLRCTKGTYVRTLCSDIGDRLGCGAHLTALRRTRSGVLDLADATPFSTIIEMDKDELLKKIIPIQKYITMESTW